jgi:mannose-6-phosphate isomerase class I
MPHVTPLYPLLTEPRLVSPMWSGTRLAAWLGVQADTPRVGESWQVYEENRITNGPLTGQTLREAAAAFGPMLVGAARWPATVRISRCWRSSLTPGTALSAGSPG